MESTRKLKKYWILSREAFDNFLVCLNDDRELAGERYEILRLKLIKFFEWRGSQAPEDHADETINRVARKLLDGEPVRDLSAYVYGTARHVLSEHRKEQSREEAISRDLADQPAIPQTEPRDGTRMECCEKCLASLPDIDRELIINYYSSEKRTKIDEHKRIADRLSISLNSMRIRVHRIKQKLEKCIINCEARRSGR